ncbi:MAG: InlB B-repeat-containing protein, partial [Firmicutes bacterium]|nr:InlB B-repeat-containing protein [Bacillota bacterium]
MHVYFTEAELSMMNDTTLSLEDTKRDPQSGTRYNITDKLFSLSKFERDLLLVASLGATKFVARAYYWNHGDPFWLCTPYESKNGDGVLYPGNYAYRAVPENGFQNKYLVALENDVRPACSLNLSSVLFASAAGTASSGTAIFGTIGMDSYGEPKAMTLRLDGSSKNIGSVTYNTTKGNIQATKGSTTGNAALVVQGNDGTNDWYYSKQITGTQTVNVSAIKSALGLSNIDLSKCKIWLETTENNLAYAVMVTGCATEAELRSAIEAGISPLTLTNDIKLSSTLELSDKIITLDLNGCVLTGDVTLIDSSAEPNTILTLIDSDPATGGVLKGNITLKRDGGSTSHLYANGGTITGTVSMSNNGSAIYCTGDTPTAFQGNVGRFGEIHGGIFYGNVTEDCIKEKTVTFMNDGSRYALEVVAGGSKAAVPVEPEKSGYVFLGWFNGNAKYDFTEAVTENITLTAKWVSESVATEDELKEAVALDSPYIKLFNDIKLSNTLDLSDKSITLDLNSHTLTGNVKLADTSAAPQSILTLIDSNPPGGGTVNGNITLTRENYGTASHLYANGGTVTGKVSLDSFIAKVYCTSDTPTAFQGDAVNYGEICGGTFYGGVQNYSTISGGIFYGGIQNISSGSVTEPYHTVSFDLNGGSGSAPTQWFVNAGTAPVLKPADPTWDTYGFVGWYNGDAKYDFTEAVTENIELIAKWVLSDVSTESELMEAVNAGATAIKLVGDCTLSSTLDLSDKNITLDLNGHTLTGNIKLEDTSAGPYSILTLIDSNPSEGGVVNGNITLTGGSGYASHLYANGGTITGQVSLLSDACKIFCTSNTPTAFMGYVGDYGEVHGGMFYGDINTGCISEHAVTFMKDSTRYALQVVATGSVAATPVEPAKDGYVYWGWYCFDAEYDFRQTVTSDITLTAKYSDPIVYNISCDLDGGTASNPDSYTVESATITLNNPVKPGYTFTGWSGTGLTGEDNMTVTIPWGSIGDRAYTAHFSQNSYTVIFNSDGGNAISEKTDVKWTDKVLDGITKPERDDYIFAGWQCGSVTVTEDTTYSQLVADDSVTSVTLHAQWENDSIILQRLVNVGGTVTLDRDYTIAAPVDVRNTVTLDLNGYVIRMIGSDSVIKVSGGGALTMQDSNPTATHTGENASLPVGGVITGGNSSSGGGVQINRSGFIMEGGTIYNCSATTQGGGVIVANGTFTMNGGTIQDCSASRGGGVYANANSVLTLNGGTIRDCTARSEGGGIYALCNVTMNDGTIQGCSATDGGGVYIYTISEFTMNGGIIEDCTATATTYGPGGAVRNHGDFLANGGEIKGTVRVYGTVQTTSSSGDCTVFYDKVTNSGTISGGIYYGDNENSGTISGGIYYGGIQNDVGGGLAVGTVSDTYYTVSFDLNGGSGSVPTQWFVNVSTAPALKPTDPTKENCVFTGWYDGDTKYDFTQPVTQDITLTAKWVSSEVSTESELREALGAGITSIKLVGDFSLSSLLDLSDKIITLDLNGHTLTGNIKLADNSVAPKSILTLIDSDPAGGGVVKGNITLTRGSGSVSHLYANGGTITGQVSLPSYAGGIFCTSDTPTAFKGYVGNYGEIHGGIFYGTVNESCIKEKTVTFMNGSSRYALEVVAEGSKVIEPASHPTKVGYNFVGWYHGDTAYAFGSALSESITLTAEFGDPLNYDITYALDGGTAVNPTSYTVESDAFTLVNPTKTGYTFTGWSGTGLSGNNNMTVTIPKGSTGNRSYTAHWTLDTYTVTLNTNGGTINSGNVTGYTYGQGAALPTDVTKTGYTFAGWYDNAACTGNPVTAISATATGEKEYWAKWDANQYAITVESAENGSVTADRNTAAMGDTVTLTVVPETCYTPETLTVTGENGDDIPVKDLGDGKYSFTMPASEV